MRSWITLTLAALFAAASVHAGEISYVETFAIGDDRDEALKQLIPGTPDYYYYHCLHDQHTGQLDKVQDMLKQWIKRYNYTDRVREIQNRQALLEYAVNPDASLRHIRDRLGMQFNHQKIELEKKVTLPTALNPELISFERLARIAFSYKKNTGNFENSAFDYLVRADLNPDQRRHLLSRLHRPDYPDMAKLVVEDLKYKHSSGFGSHPVHNALLLDQLEACLVLDPDLIKNTNFINVYLKKLHPGNDVDWQRDPAERDAYLERLEAFVKRLPPVQNSLKANVLYQRLHVDHARGVYNKNRFMEYIKLPRNVHYVNRDYLKRREFYGQQVNLGADFKAVTLLPPVGADEELVRDHLMHFLKDAENFKEYEDYIEHNYLKELFAETKMVNGIGDMEQWYSMLKPEKVRALKERVDIELLPTNPEFVGDDDPVTLAVAVKNVEKLIIKTFEVNTYNYYREKQEEISTAIDLDGLVANVEQTLAYNTIPMRRHVETFKFPHIKRPGVYVIELIGNGISSRALVRKGRLTFTQRLGSAGHVFTVFNGAGKKVKGATIWLSGHEYTADDDGEIAVPFSTRPGNQDIVITYDGFSSLGEFVHLSEKYNLKAGFYAETESLLERETCRVVVRPELTVNNVRVGIELLEKPVLAIRSTDIEGISSSKDIKDFKLYDDKESVYEFKVPEGLINLQFTLRGKVKNVSENKEIDLSAVSAISINGIDQTDKTEALHLRHTKDGYILELLGKTGEPRTDRPVYFSFKHKDFTRIEHVTLKTDEKGRVTLGALKDIVQVTARGPEETSRTWHMRSDGCTHRRVLHALAGEPIEVAYMHEAPEDPALAVSLLELRGDTFASDQRQHVAFKDGFLVIDGLAPGDYDLYIKPSNRRITIKVTAGRREDQQLLSKHRVLEQIPGKPLQIRKVAAEGDTVKVELANVTSSTRLHAVATRFVGDATPYDWLGNPTVLLPSENRFLVPRSFYLSGRNIGDEYRYILERKYAKRYPGNMLKRPSLLLNPWSLRKTDTGIDHAKAPVVMKGIYGSRSPGSRGAALGAHRGGGHAAKSFPDLNFLPRPTAVIENLVPDRRGRIEIPREALGGGQQVHLVAVNGGNVVYRQLALPEIPEKCRDLRLARILNPEAHFSEQKNITVAKAGSTFAVDDLRTSKVEVYDSLTKVYTLFATLSKDPTLTEFGFVTGWPELEDEKKRELYSKHACHELNFFLYHKDPAFFKSVIRPYLANKKDKTFMDHWLLGEKLDDYLEPWKFGRLNITERSLLAQRIRGEGPHAARHVKDLYDLIPPDIEHFNHLFKTALKAGALETKGLGSELEELEEVAAAADMVVAEGAVFKYARAKRVAAAEPAPPVTAAPPAEMLLALRAGEEKARERLKSEVARKAQVVGGAVAELDDAVFADRRAKDKVRREEVRPFYQKLDKTEEWVENNYYHLPIEQQVASLVTVNGLWKDYAAGEGKPGFLSRNVAESSRSFTDMMLALAVTELPFKSGEHKTELKGIRLELVPGHTSLVYHKEIREVKEVEEAQVILVSQNFFALDDRYRFENNERFDKFVTEEFQSARVYGCQVVLTNPTSTRRKVDVLLQIPEGAMPVRRGFFTRSLHRQLEAYSTETVEYYFYFPSPGMFRHYPVHVAQGETLIACSKPFTFDVKTKLTKIDTEAWSYVSQHGSDEQVLTYLKDHNIDRVDVNLIAFRMRERGFFETVIPLLTQRHVYNDVLWSYGIYHNHVPTIRQYLPHTSFAKRCGLYIDTPLLTLEPIIRHEYQHKEYWPLVNARVYQLGKKRKILNQQFHAQYEQFMTYLAYKPELDDADRMALVVYLLLQDRVTDAMKCFDRVVQRKVHTDIQYDYLAAYMAFYRESPDAARKLAAPYAEHPVKRWRNLFGDVIAQADEIAGKGTKIVDDEDRTQQQTRLAATAPALDFMVEDRVATIRYQNLERCRVNFYLMDIELLFSRQPFVQEVRGQFSVIKPNQTLELKLDKDKDVHALELPKEFRDRNVMIEVSAAGINRMQAYYPHSLAIQVMENYGQVRVADEKTGKALSKVYVKVYARMHGGAVQFFKDGYTDLRGRFDYTSLNTNEIDNVEKFAILIMSDDHGAVVREADKPKM